MIRRMVNRMRKHKYLILIPVLTITLCWTLMTDATGSKPGTLEYLELFSQCYELVQSHYLEETDPKILAEGAVEGMLLATSPYAALIPKSGSSGLIPAFGPASSGIIMGFRDPMIQVIDVLPGSPAEEQGILPGDTLIRIGDQVTPYLTLDRASRMMTGEPGDKITVFLQNNLSGELSEKELVLKPVDTASSGLQVSLQDGFRLIRITGELTPAVPDRIFDELNGSENRPTVLDLRHINRGVESTGIAIADMFIEDGRLMLSLCRKDDKVISEIKSGDGRALTGFPLAVIIDSTSAGPAEACAAAIQATGRGIVTGDTSFGKAVDQELQTLDETYDIIMVTGYHCLEGGKKIDQTGIKPDVAVVLPINSDSDPYIITACNQLSALKAHS